MGALDEPPQSRETRAAQLRATGGGALPEQTGSPLHMAAKGGHCAALRVLLENPDADTEAQDSVRPSKPQPRKFMSDPTEIAPDCHE